MKKIILMCGLAATLFSCAKEKHAEPLVSADPVEVEINIEADGFALTKAASDPEKISDSEVAIKSVEVFAFNSQGNLVGYKDATTTDAFTISVVPGIVTFHALVNNKSKIGIAGVSNVATLLAKSQQLDATYKVATSGIPMYGVSAATTVTTSGASVSITLQRNLARVDVLKISNTTEGVLAVSPITVSKIWLTNVVGSYMVNGGCFASLWYNKVGSAIDAPSSEYVREISTILAHGESYSTAQHFYTCPNDNEGNALETWSAAATYFNLACKISGDDYNFRFKLPSLVGNKVYKINEVKISGAGAMASASLTFTVGDWTTTIIGDNGVVEFGKQ